MANSDYTCCACCVLITAITCVILFPVPFLLGFGYSNLSHGRNTAVTGVITGYDKDNLQKCSANVTFLTLNNINVSGGPIVTPCEPGRIGEKIDICYNRKNPENFAFADHDIHAVSGDNGKLNPFDFCADIGYGSAIAMILAAYIICAVVTFVYCIVLGIWIYRKLRPIRLKNQNFVQMV